NVSGTASGKSRTAGRTAFSSPVWDYPFYEEAGSFGTESGRPDMEGEFFTGPDALYALDADGSRIYVLRQKS
ncbi:MAG: hypothetical protein ACSW8K_04270, partial [bacterium]